MESQRQNRTVTIKLKSGAQQTARGTEVLDQDEHCLVIKDNDTVIAWFDWANVVSWSEALELSA